MLHTVNHTLMCSINTHTPTFHRSEQVLENLAKFTEVPGLFFLCSSRQDRTKKAYAEVRPFGLFASFTMAAAKRGQKYHQFELTIYSMQNQFPDKVQLMLFISSSSELALICGDLITAVILDVAPKKNLNLRIFVCQFFITVYICLVAFFKLRKCPQIQLFSKTA